MNDDKGSRDGRRKISTSQRAAVASLLPNELERARMRRILRERPPSLSTGVAPARIEDAFAAVAHDVRALRGDVSRHDELWEKLIQVLSVEPVADEVLTRSEVATLLKVCPESVTKWVRHDGLPCKRVGIEYRFLRSEVVAWLSQRDVRKLGEE